MSATCCSGGSGSKPAGAVALPRSTASLSSQAACTCAHAAPHPQRLIIGPGRNNLSEKWCHNALFVRAPGLPVMLIFLQRAVRATPRHGDSVLDGGNRMPSIIVLMPRSAPETVASIGAI